MARVVVDVMLKPEILDPQGQAVANALPRLGVDGVGSVRIGKRIEGIDKATMRRLIAYPWPGNVRELENVLERAVILAPGPALEVGADVLPVNAEAPTSEVQVPEQPATLEATDREHILTVLRQTGWVVEGSRGAAKILGLHPNTLRSRMKKLGIRRTPHDPS